MRLRTFESFWLVKNGLINSYPSLNSEVDTEVLVIGGGITGALVSDALMSAGHKVCLIDKRDIGQGSTSATTSMLQYEIDEPLIDLAEKIGEKGAVACYHAGIKAIKDLDKLVQKRKVDCGFEMKQSLYLAHSVPASRWLKEEYEMRHQYEMGVQWLEANEVRQQFGIVCKGAILSDTAASVDAYALAHGLIAYNVSRGMKVYDQTTLRTIKFGKKGHEVFILGGGKINCQQIIFCSGFESVKWIPEKVADLFDTYACVSEQGIKLPTAVHDTLVWDTADPYIYMRTTDDGRLLIGGEDADSTNAPLREKMKERKAEKLQHKLKQMMPEVTFTEDFTWGGTFGSTKDGLPYIGAHKKYPNTHFVMGFGGNGITFSVQAREIIVAMLKGEKHPLQQYYRFGR